MNFLTRLKAAFSNSAYMTSSVKVISGGDAVRQPFSYQSAVRAYRSWIYAAANLNAVAVASQPLRLYVRSTGVGTKLWRTRKVSIRQKAYLAGNLAQVPSRSTMTKAAEYGDDFEVVTEMHPILELLAKVNPYQNGFDATVLRVLYTELTGNAYLHPVMDRALGRPVELWTMPSQNVEIVPGKETLVEGYLYGQSREQRRFFATDEVIHFKRPNPADLYYGLGKAEAAWGAAMANEAIHEMDLSFFANKARPDYLMTFKGAADPSEIERLEVQIDEKLRGTKRTGRFLTMSSDIDLKPMGFPPKDLAGRGEIVEEIAAVFGVPVSMLKANDPNLASATVGFAAWKQNTILPLLRMDEEVLNQNLIPLFGIEGDAFLAYDNPVLEDERFEFERIRTSVAAGLLTVNEARKAQGLEAVADPAADQLLFNNQPLGGPVPPALPPLPEPPTGPTSSPTEPVGGEDTTEPVLAADLPAEPPADGQTAGKAVPSTKGATAARGRQDAMLTLGEVDGLTDFRKAAGSECVSDKIRTLLDEGYEQDQAVAIAISMCDAGAKAVGDIDTKPPAVVAENAERALAVREEKPESERGMTAVGIARARDLANRASLSEETIRRMVAYFERHQSDKRGESWDEQGKGWQAWNGWGGDEGWSWAKRKRDEFNRERELNSERNKKSCGCGCRNYSTNAAKVEYKDCGTGSGGFQTGNSCGSEEGSGGDDASSVENEARNASRISERFGNASVDTDGLIRLGGSEDEIRASLVGMIEKWQGDSMTPTESLDLAETIRKTSIASQDYRDAAASYTLTDGDEMLLMQSLKRQGRSFEDREFENLQRLRNQEGSSLSGLSDESLRRRASQRSKIIESHIQTVTNQAQSKLPDTMVVHRGMIATSEQSREFIRDIKPGATLESGIISTSMNASVARNYAGDLRQDRILMKIKTDRGIVAQVDERNERIEGHLQEVVLAPKRLRVVSVNRIVSESDRQSAGEGWGDLVIGGKKNTTTIIEMEAEYE